MTRQAMTTQAKFGHSRCMHGLALWGLVGACVLAGCGARTLPGGPTPPVDDASPPFFVCPFAPPPTDSTCDSVAQVCVYEGVSACQSVECDDTGHWQPSQQGC